MTFEDFFDYEYPRLVAMLRSLTGDISSAEDVAQESMTAASKSGFVSLGWIHPGRGFAVLP